MSLKGRKYSKGRSALCCKRGKWNTTVFHQMLRKKRIGIMSNVSDLSSILQNSLLLDSYKDKDKDKTSKNQFEQLADVLENIKKNPYEDLLENSKNIPNILDKQTLSKLSDKDNEFGITLKEYTNFSTYNTMMNTLYGNNSANKFQNTLNILTNSATNELATAKTFVEKMKENGMTNSNAVKTYSALKQYSMLSSSFGNYSFVKANA